MSSAVNKNVFSLRLNSGVERKCLSSIGSLLQARGAAIGLGRPKLAHVHITRFAHRRVSASGGCIGWRGNVLAVGNCCYVAVCSTAQGASAPTGEGEGRRHIVAAARLQLVSN